MAQARTIEGLDPEFRGSTDVGASPHDPGWDPSELATVVLFDRQGWLTAVAAVLLALITLFIGYSHVDLLGAASIDLPQQAGIPCIDAALATALAEAQLETNLRFESAAISA